MVLRFPCLCSDGLKALGELGNAGWRLRGANHVEMKCDAGINKGAMLYQIEG